MSADNRTERTSPTKAEDVIEDTVPFGCSKSTKRKREALGDGDCPVSRALDRRVVRSLTKPLYLLGLGSTAVRPEHRDRLAKILARLERGRDWARACGVAAVLLKGTRKDKCPAANRFKYSVSMELLKHIKNYQLNSRAVNDVYDTWMKRVGINLSNTRRTVIEKNTFAVRLESILFHLIQGDVEAEHQNARSLMQEHGFESHSQFNLTIGLIFSQMWYSSIPEDLQWKDSDRVESLNFHMSPTPLELDNSAARVSQEVEDLEDHSDNFSNQSDISVRYDSDTSVRNDKEVSMASDGEFDGEGEPVRVVDSSPRENPHDHLPQGFYVTSSENEASADNDGDNMHSIPDNYALERLEPWLLPLRARIWELDRIIINDEYRIAVKCLRDALYSTPPQSAALLPLVKLLVIGREYKEALNEVESFSASSSTALSSRLRANLLELIDSDNRIMLSSCYEDSLKSDPTCNQSLARLISLHKDGHYAAESLLESIALHLDAAFPEHDTWREFALCFLKVSQCEVDRMSTCLHGDAENRRHDFSVRYNRIPKMFMHGESGRSWKLRWRWWLKRHFRIITILSEIAAGNMELLTYKAACASHMYGYDSDYTMKVYTTLLQKENDRNLLMFLKQHMDNSVGLHLNFKQRTQ